MVKSFGHFLGGIFQHFHFNQIAGTPDIGLLRIAPWLGFQSLRLPSVNCLLQVWNMQSDMIEAGACSRWNLRRMTQENTEIAKSGTFTILCRERCPA